MVLLLQQDTKIPAYPDDHKRMALTAASAHISSSQSADTPLELHRRDNLEPSMRSPVGVALIDTGQLHGGTRDLLDLLGNPLNLDGVCSLAALPWKASEWTNVLTAHVPLIACLSGCHRCPASASVT